MTKVWHTSIYTEIFITVKYISSIFFSLFFQPRSMRSMRLSNIMQIGGSCFGLALLFPILFRSE